MRSLIFALLSLALALVAVVAAPAQTLSDADRAAMRTARRRRAQGGDWTQAYASRRISDPLALKIVRWLDYTSAGAPRPLRRHRRFHRTEPGLAAPEGAAQARRGGARRRNATTVAADWLKRYPPVSAAGKARSAEILINSRRCRRRHSSVAHRLDRRRFRVRSTKTAFSLRYGAAIRPQDDERRLDRLLWDGRIEAARRMLPLRTRGLSGAGGGAAGACR